MGILLPPKYPYVVKQPPKNYFLHYVSVPASKCASVSVQSKFFKAAKKSQKGYRQKSQDFIHNYALNPDVRTSMLYHARLCLQNFLSQFFHNFFSALPFTN